jgi:hypothetical protein
VQRRYRDTLGLSSANMDSTNVVLAANVSRGSSPGRSSSSGSIDGALDASDEHPARLQERQKIRGPPPYALAGLPVSVRQKLDHSPGEADPETVSRSRSDPPAAQGPRAPRALLREHPQSEAPAARSPGHEWECLGNAWCAFPRSQTPRTRRAPTCVVNRAAGGRHGGGQRNNDSRNPRVRSRGHLRASRPRTSNPACVLKRGPVRASSQDARDERDEGLGRMTYPQRSSVAPAGVQRGSIGGPA